MDEKSKELKSEEEDEQEKINQQLKQRLSVYQNRIDYIEEMGNIGDWHYNTVNKQVMVSNQTLKIMGVYYDGCPNVWKYERFFDACDNDMKKMFDSNIFCFTKENKMVYDNVFSIKIEGVVRKFHIIARRDLRDFTGDEIICGSIQDITEMVMLEESLRQSERLSAVGQLAGGIAHDFNNILMAAKGYAELIKLKTDSDTIIRYSNNIIKSVDRSSDLTSKLLAFSRKDSAFKEEIHIHESVVTVLELISRTMFKNIMLECKLLAENDFIYGDTAEIQNIFMNLCINARDALKRGGIIRIISQNVTLDKTSKFMNKFDLVEGQYIRFSVMDNGCGISKENMKKIFDPFFTTKGVGKGTGLGLSAIYGTMITHNGAITVESKLDKGTTFELYFPIFEKAAENS